MRSMHTLVLYKFHSNETRIFMVNSLLWHLEKMLYWVEIFVIILSLNQKRGITSQYNASSPFSWENEGLTKHLQERSMTNVSYTDQPLTLATETNQY